MLPERYIDLSNKKHIPEPRYTAWERNVIDKYKQLSNVEIAKEVAANKLPYAILMTHIEIDYNLGAVLRIGNCLGAKVFYYGKRKFDRRGTCGVYHYDPITYLSSIEEVRKLKEEYNFVALEQTENSIPLPQFNWTFGSDRDWKKTMIVVGEESRGLQATPEILELADCIVEIPQKGSVRSLNAATSVAIASYDLCLAKGYF